MYRYRRALPVLSPAGWLVKNKMGFRVWGLRIFRWLGFGVWGFSIDWGLGLWDGVRGLGWGFKHGSQVGSLERSKLFGEACTTLAIVLRKAKTTRARVFTIIFGG